MAKQQVIALDELKDGRIMDEIQNAARQVVADIKDENKEAGKRRALIIRIDFDPTEDRKGSNIAVSVKATLAGARKIGTMLWFEQKGKEVIAHDEDPAQQKLLK